MSAETAEILEFPSWQTEYPDINAIIEEARQNDNIVSLLARDKVKNLPEAMVLLNSDIVDLFPQVRVLPDRSDDTEFQKFKTAGSGDEQATILAANTLYITEHIIKAIRPDLFI